MLAILGLTAASLARLAAQPHQVQRLPPVGSRVPVSGYTVKHVSVPPDYFGEGITTWGQTIVQLTWQSQVGFVYDRNTFKQLRTFKYTGEGWGLTHNATQLIMSDGSASLRFLDPKTLTETDRVLVTDAGIVVRDLNELEWVNGE